MSDITDKYGARVFQVSDSVLLIKQTVKWGKNQNDPYIIDGQKECHVDINNDAEIANGVRKAMKGNLTAGKE